MVSDYQPALPAYPKTGRAAGDKRTAHRSLRRERHQSSARHQLADACDRPGSRLLGRPVREQTLALENSDVRYVFTSREGGLKSVELKDYPATVACRNQTASTAKQLATLNAVAPTPILAIMGDDRIEGDGFFTLTNFPGGLRAEKTLTNGLRIVKEFRPSTNYLLKTTVRLENTSANRWRCPARNGSAPPPQ